jgi:hypothetical protein
MENDKLLYESLQSGRADVLLLIGKIPMDFFLG